VEVVNVPAKWKPPDSDDWIEDYRAGKSVKQLADEFGIARNAVTRTLTERGVIVRDNATANRLMQADRSPEQRALWTQAAHDAARGRVNTFEEKCLGALTRQRTLGIRMSPSEQLFAGWLRDRGIDTVPQLAIGPYNVDLAADPVAVEIFGGGWHGYGAHAARSAERFRYILDEGWAVIVVWSAVLYRISAQAADEVVAFVEQARCDPTLRGEYRMIRGNGHFVASGRENLDHLTRVPPGG
jgi:very-short-patch-repair endonuclease